MLRFLCEQQPNGTASTRVQNRCMCRSVQQEGVFLASRPALPANAKLISGPVGYYSATDDSLQKLMNASPEQIVLSKLEGFSYQEEYRFAFSATNALDVGRARHPLREFKPVPNPSEHHEELLQLGTLRDICKLHEFTDIVPSPCPSSGSCESGTS
jgi:hypothetical protein